MFEFLLETEMLYQSRTNDSLEMIQIKKNSLLSDNIVADCLNFVNFKVPVNNVNLLPYTAWKFDPSKTQFEIYPNFIIVLPSKHKFLERNQC